jgi:ribosome-binding protein aMBF1 (putative translation factor)
MEETQLWVCPTCAAQFTREYAHCAECGRHGEHECSPDDAARKERARAFIEKGLGKKRTGENRTWSELTYDYREDKQP